MVLWQPLDFAGPENYDLSDTDKGWKYIPGLLLVIDSR